MKTTHLKLTSHARRRCAQRCYREKHLALVLQYGTPTCDGVLMRKKDVQQAIADLRLQLHRLEHSARFAEAGIGTYRTVLGGR